MIKIFSNSECHRSNTIELICFDASFTHPMALMLWGLLRIMSKVGNDALCAQQQLILYDYSCGILHKDFLPTICIAMNHTTALIHWLMFIIRHITSLLAIASSITFLIQPVNSFHPASSTTAIHHTTKNFSTSKTTTMTSTSNNNGSNKLQVLSKIAVTQNNGNLLRIRHTSTSTQTEMTFSLFLPSTYGTLLRSKGQSIPALYWLSKFICVVYALFVLWTCVVYKYIPSIWSRF